MMPIAAILGSMELALVKTSEQLNVSVESLKKLGEIPEEDSFSGYAEESLIAEYLELFVGFM